MVLCGLCTNIFLVHIIPPKAFGPYNVMSQMAQSPFSSGGDGGSLPWILFLPSLLKASEFKLIEKMPIFGEFSFDAAESTLTNAFLQLTGVLTKAIALNLLSPLQQLPESSLSCVLPQRQLLENVIMYEYMFVHLPFSFVINVR